MRFLGPGPLWPIVPIFGPGSGEFGDQGGRAELDSAPGHGRGVVAAGEGRASRRGRLLGGRVEHSEGRRADDEEGGRTPVEDPAPPPLPFNRWLVTGRCAHPRSGSSLHGRERRHRGPGRLIGSDVTADRRGYTVDIDAKECSVPTNSAAPGLAALGWDEGWACAMSELGDPTLLPARVSRVDRGLSTVMTGDAEVRVVAERGVEVAVGDWVAVGPVPATGEERPRIVAVLPRRCVFRRAADTRGKAQQIVAANIDTVLLFDALDGHLSLRHLERYLALAWQSGATPVVLITKSDAASAAEVAEAVESVKTVAEGVSIVVVSATTGDGIGDLAPYLVPGRTVALLGLSGAGKSTLVNLLAGADLLATGAVRSDGKGRHTTTHRELVLLPGGGLLIDTPGMRALSVVGAGEGVEQAFHDLEVLANDCQYANCIHHADEQGCALAAAVADGRLARGRLEAWLRLRAEPRSSDYESARRVVDDRKRRKATKIADRRAARP